MRMERGISDRVIKAAIRVFLKSGWVLLLDDV